MKVYCWFIFRKRSTLLRLRHVTIRVTIFPFDFHILFFHAYLNFLTATLRPSPFSEFSLILARLLLQIVYQSPVAHTPRLLWTIFNAHGE